MNHCVRAWAGPVLLATGLLAFSGCRREEARVYQVPKETDPSLAESTAPADSAIPPFMAAASQAQSDPAKPPVT